MRPKVLSEPDSNTCHTLLGTHRHMHDKLEGAQTSRMPTQSSHSGTIIYHLLLTNVGIAAHFTGPVALESDPRQQNYRNLFGVPPSFSMMFPLLSVVLCNFATFCTCHDFHYAPLPIIARCCLIDIAVSGHVFVAHVFHGGSTTNIETNEHGQSQLC